MSVPQTGSVEKELCPPSHSLLVRCARARCVAGCRNSGQSSSDLDVRPALINGAVGTVTLRDGRPFAIAGFTIRNRRVVEMDILTDPERLRQIDLTILD
jgi:hypothetical protein